MRLVETPPAGVGTAIGGIATGGGREPRPDRVGTAPAATKPSRTQATVMRLSVLLIVVILGAVVAGGVFLTTWKIPAPTQKVEKVIPNDRFEQ